MTSNEWALAADDIVVRFGGLVAVDHVSLRVGPGQAVGLIGPNGAGKTTFFNACSGLLQPAEGSVALFGEDVTALGPAARATRGLGRTFQSLELFDRLTVWENVAMGLEARLAGQGLLRTVLATSQEKRRIVDETSGALDRCGIADLADRPAGLLSSGQRRLVELARVLASGARLLLLDEPSSGLDTAETESFASVLHAALGGDGRSCLLVEHDMSLVRSVCDYAYVLDFGKLVADGPTADVLASSVVRSAYLGTEDVA